MKIQSQNRADRALKLMNAFAVRRGPVYGAPAEPAGSLVRKEKTEAHCDTCIVEGTKHKQVMLESEDGASATP